MTNTVTLFVGDAIVCSGTPKRVGEKARRCLQDDSLTGVLLFDDLSGQQLDVDLRNGQIYGLDATPSNIQKKPQGRGRPRLGVVSREVTLLPDHWQWLSKQPGGASAALRRLVNKARDSSSARDCVRQSQNAAYVFMNAIAGNLVNYEEANRALFAGQKARFVELISQWPADIGEYARRLAEKAFP